MSISFKRFLELIDCLDRRNHFGTIRYYRYPHTMHQNIKETVQLYSGDKPIKNYSHDRDTEF